jgi:predicted nucleotidyltransferase component of viral defense system
MEYSKEDLKSFSSRSSFLESNLEKVLRLTDVLDFVFSDPRLRNKLVLKGGTAINLCYTGLRRLSVDVDFDYVGSLDADTTKRERSEILALLGDFLMRSGYLPLLSSRKHYALSSQSFTYQNASGNKDTIKIEINFLDRVHVFAPQETTYDLFGKKHRVVALKKEELFGSKIAALVNRTKPRDLYDVYQLAQNPAGINRDELRCALLFYLAMDDVFEYNETILAPISRLTYREIRSELKPVLMKNDPFVLAKAQRCVQTFLLSFAMDKNEQAFLLSAKAGIFDFSMLSSDPDFMEKMNAHPLVRWKKHLVGIHG